MPSLNGSTRLSPTHRGSVLVPWFAGRRANHRETSVAITCIEPSPAGSARNSSGLALSPVSYTACTGSAPSPGAGSPRHLISTASPTAANSVDSRPPRHRQRCRARSDLEVGVGGCGGHRQRERPFGRSPHRRDAHVHDATVGRASGVVEDSHVGCARVERAERGPCADVGRRLVPIDHRLGERVDPRPRGEARAIAEAHPEIGVRSHGRHWLTRAEHVVVRWVGGRPVVAHVESRDSSGKLAERASRGNRERRELDQLRDRTGATAGTSMLRTVPVTGARSAKSRPTGQRRSSPG